MIMLNRTFAVYWKLAIWETALLIPESEEELTEIFRRLGAKSPESWARSQVTEGIPQLLRFLFLQQAWSRIIAEGETSWIDREISNAKTHPDRPYAGLGLALARCVEKGTGKEDLSEIARCIQARTLFDIGYLIDGPARTTRGLEGLTWGLFQTDEDRNPIGSQVVGLHESVLELDPTGREMRPKSDG